ncbi:osmoprotectant transport system permease protein [Arthrobacter sp. CAN_A212]|uniref:ABC transporter permease n=1 Tax=unclassified Arthrobacter TaxID=235627 RepID=UPI0018CBE496|nr:ABC transporter permease [Arthrobacter sp. CAN_C5]MBP2216264.1 osmoprotectant transport system permease protein [Arthrobacter sp. CAN_C5]
MDYLEYLLDPEHWDLAVNGNIPSLIVDHLYYTVITLLIASLIAIPVGLYIGHTGRFSFVAINAGNAGRSLPTLGLIILLVTVIGFGLLPVVIALVILAIPPILTSTYAGLRAINPASVDAAKGMGMRPLQILFRVEIPIALPLILSGLRSATLQVVSTATVASYVGLGGLGRLLVDGLALNQYDRVIAGAVVVALLAIVLDLIASGLQRLVVSPGVSGRALTRTSNKPARSAPEAAPAAAG